MKNQFSNQKITEQQEEDQIQTKTRVIKNWQKVRQKVKNKNLQNNIPLYHLFTIQTKNLQKSIRSINYVHQFTIFTNAPNPNFQYLTSKQTDNIDTTGTFAWEAQHLLTYFLYKNQKYGKVKNILQLGAGTSGLASLLFGMKYKAQKILITDGKEENIEYLDMNIKENNLQQSIRSQKYVWGSNTITQKFELIIASDCLFFENYHEELIKTLVDNLQQDGRILLVNPKRGKSMYNFLKKLKDVNFQYDIIDFDDGNFKNNQTNAIKHKKFDKDKDIYYFLEVRKIKNIDEQKSIESRQEKQ